MSLSHKQLIQETEEVYCKAIYAGKTGEYIATKNIKNEKYIVVIYKELENPQETVRLIYHQKPHENW